ncbi:MAG: hypothetical protein JWO86_7892, partial [Myxococcaceae bacterium]|nr:hypothetical protein [Myxococcaceae bacterium]
LFRVIAPLLACAAGAFAPSPAFAAPNPRLVTSLSSYDNFGPTQIVVAGGKLFFDLDDGPSGTLHGTELWVSDGTAAGTRMVTDIVPGSASSAPSCLVGIGATVFFNVSRGASPQTTTELWKSDGTAAGTVRVGNLRTTDRTYDRDTLGGKLFFDATQDTAGAPDWEPWMTDGTTTTRLADVDPSGPSTPSNVYARNGKMYFMAKSPGHTSALWVTDASGATPVRLTDNAEQNGYAHGFEAMGSYVYFSKADNTETSLYRTDGTPAGTSLVKGGFAPVYSPDNMYALPTQRMLFRAFDVAHGGELWVTDGTAAGTSLVQDINPGTNDSLENLGSGAVYHGALYFRADDGVHGGELWKTDGSPAGTMMFADIAPGAASGAPRSFTVVGDRLVFVATDPTRGTELWETDGTQAGTHVVADLRPGAGSSSPRNLTVLANSVFFVTDANDGPELWVYDAPPAPGGADAGAGVDGGVVDDGGPGASALDASTSASTDGSAESSADPSSTGSTGCGCVVAGSASPSEGTTRGLWGLGATLVVVWHALRRRRARASSR